MRITKDMITLMLCFNAVELPFRVSYNKIHQNSNKFKGLIRGLEEMEDEQRQSIEQYTKISQNTEKGLEET